MSQTIPGSDPVYKRLYAFPDMVEDLLRSLFPADILGAVDLRSLGRLPAEYVGDDFRRRHGDAVWRARMRSDSTEWLHVLVLLEFQSGNDRAMAVRVLEYTAMLYRELLRGGGVDHAGRLPPVLPVVLYNGAARWRAVPEVAELIAACGPGLAPYQPSQRHMVLDERHIAADDPRLGRLTRAVVSLEQSRSPADLARVAKLLTEWLDAPGRQELKRAFADWLWTLWRRLERGSAPAAAPPPELTLEEVRMTLEERVSRWPEPWIRQGVEQGLAQGIEQGVAQGKAQGIEQGVAQGIEQGVAQGKAQGIEQGVREGLDRQRALLRRQAEARFGAPTADRLFARLRSVEDPEWLADVGEVIVRCETGEDLLRHAGA